MSKIAESKRSDCAESKKDYLRRILNINRGDAGYSDMDTYIKEYNNFMRTLNYNFIRGGEEEKIFVYFHEHNLTPSNIAKKEKGKDQLKNDLKILLKKSNEYYNNVLYPEYYKNAKRMRPQDAQIELSDKKRNNNVIGDLNDVEKFICLLDDKWNKFIYYLYMVIDLVFDKHDFLNEQFLPISAKDFEKALNDEIAFYKENVNSYYHPFDIDTDGEDMDFEHDEQFNDIESYDEVYYIGKNDNPYKNLYIYCMMAYLKNFYEIDIPLIDIEKPFGFENIDKIDFNKLMSKKTFSLTDIAEIYSIMSNCDEKKAYEKIKQQFRKSFYMSRYKCNGEYKFNKLEIPLATYAYYSKKNHAEPNPILAYYLYFIDKNYDEFKIISYDVILKEWNSKLWEKFECTNYIQEYNPLITFIYAPLLRSALLHENEKLITYNKFREFIIQGFKNMLKIVDDGHLKYFIDFILECPMRLYYRCFGMDINSIEGKIPL